MMGRTHVITGAAFGCWYAAVLPAPDLVRVVCAGTVAVAATFPDIDHHKGMVSTYVWPFTNILSWIVRRFVRHRGALHRPRAALFAAVVACALAGVVAGFLSLTTPSPIWSYWWAWGGAVGLGWLVHLIFDARTHSGIPVGNNLHWTLGRTIRTGGKDGAEVRLRLRWWRIAWVSVPAAWIVSGSGWLPWTQGY